MDRVHCYRDPALDAVHPARWPTEVTIELRDGRTLHQRVDHPQGVPENPLSPAELQAKLAGLAGGVSAKTREGLAALVLDADLDVPAARLTDAIGAALIA